MSTEDLKKMLQTGVIAGIISVLIILSNYADIIGPIQDGFDRMLVPLQRGVFAVDTSIGNFFESIASPGKTQKENRLLREELARLQSENAKLSRLEEENAFLRSQAGVVADAESEYLLARVVSFDRDIAGIGRLKFDMGTDHDVEVGRLVLVKSGILFGKVVEASKYTCLVEPINVSSARIPVITEISQARGLLLGEDRKGMVVGSIARETKVELGEKIYTSGEDGVYPRGLLVGTVVEDITDPAGAFKKFVIEPFYNMATIEYVFIEVK